ncbi:MAG TPA: protein-L-isoaspartate(D-aspartate) O-methyltransferase [Candidatus Acidoferrum sp.]|nr:protein-L-isoaspartate(D-aspartate) O-methyltransferase [Candidatus Acidoferrum sp.]
MKSLDDKLGVPRLTQASPAESFSSQRKDMIQKQLERRGIADSRVLAAMDAVPREEFVPQEVRSRAYEDAPLPIGEGQTISQPYIVAAMTAALRLTGSERVLEVGTGCGYQAAILSRLAQCVYTVEARPKLASDAAARLLHLGYSNVHGHCGDGTLGLPEAAPFDAILVAAAAPAVPEPLRAQLAQGGRLILPVGDATDQELRYIEKHGNTFFTRSLEGCRFVPLVGLHGWKEPPAR